jgi:hypothetical protein
VQVAIDSELGIDVPRSRNHSDLSSSQVRIRYCNASGDYTERIVEPIQYFRARDGREFLKAWCHLRQEERTFRVDRIQWARRIDGSPVTFSESQASSHALVPYNRSQPARKLTPSSSHRPIKTVAPIRYTPTTGSSRASTQTRLDYQSRPTVERLPPRKTVVSKDTPAATQQNTPQQGTSLGKYFLRTAAIVVAILLVRGYFVDYEDGSYVRPPVVQRLFAELLQNEQPSPSHFEINTVEFMNSTGITDANLIAKYAQADSNRDRHLSWSEVETFQLRLNRAYDYLANDTALRPDEFIAAGGGDCEDWSLVTAGLLQFWGWETYIGSLRSSDGEGAHAVCLVRLSSKPSTYSYYQFEESAKLGSKWIRAGFYVPIDYAHVGSLSNAVNKRWTLKYIRVPAEIYGLAM